MQDRPDRLEPWGRQVQQVQRATLDLWGQWARLGLVAQMAWLDLLARPESEASKAQREQRARVDRLVRRGIPEPLARQGLRAL